MGPLDFILHVDSYLQTAIEQLGAWTYVLLFGVIFAETGLVVTPFLPGDSLLFAVGAFAGAGSLELWVAMPVLFAAAVIGDTVNYWIGQKLGHRAFARKRSRIFKPEYLARTEAFYEKHGGKTIIIARFLPIVRTFVPFVAGVGSMRYPRFLLYNVIGAFIWVTSLTLAGYFFGSIPIVQENFEIAVILIVLASVLPTVHHVLKERRRPQATPPRYGDVKRSVNK